MNNRQIRIAACQMQANLGNIPENLRYADRLLEEAFSKGAQWAILPEFFSTAIAFHPSLNQAALPLDGAALELLRSHALRHHAYVGGSFLAITNDGEHYNTFVLVRPDGSYGTHDKDLPTMWENCYYRGGSDDGIVSTSEGSIGIVMCWEFVRWQTARRLFGKVDLLVGGSCWPSFPQLPILKTLFAGHEAKNLMHVEKSFAQMARLLGVPVVQAAHAGDVQGRIPMLGLPYPTFFTGETQIVDGEGNILARRTRSDGEGVICATVEIGAKPTKNLIQEGYWIPELPWSMKVFWPLFNWHGRRYYRRQFSEKSSST